MAYRANRNKERTLIRLFQEVIDDNNLIDTGALRASVDVEVQVTRAGLMLVDVSSQDYLKYLYERFFLIEDFTAKPQFSQVVRDIFADFIQKEIIRKYPLQDAAKLLEKLNTRVTVQIVN